MYSHLLIYASPTRPAVFIARDVRDSGDDITATGRLLVMNREVQPDATDTHMTFASETIDVVAL